jgi:hypothetical protein
MKKTKNNPNHTKDQLNRRVVKRVMLVCPGGMVLGYV